MKKVYILLLIMITLCSCTTKDVKYYNWDFRDDNIDFSIINSIIIDELDVSETSEILINNFDLFVSDNEVSLILLEIMVKQYTTESFEIQIQPDVFISLTRDTNSENEIETILLDDFCHLLNKIKFDEIPPHSDSGNFLISYNGQIIKNMHESKSPLVLFTNDTFEWLEHENDGMYYFPQDNEYALLLLAGQEMMTNICIDIQEF